MSRRRVQEVKRKAKDSEQKSMRESDKRKEEEEQEENSRGNDEEISRGTKLFYSTLPFHRI